MSPEIKNDKKVEPTPEQSAPPNEPAQGPSIDRSAEQHRAQVKESREIVLAAAADSKVERTRSIEVVQIVQQQTAEAHLATQIPQPPVRDIAIPAQKLEDALKELGSVEATDQEILEAVERIAERETDYRAMESLLEVMVKSARHRLRRVAKLRLESIDDKLVDDNLIFAILHKLAQVDPIAAAEVLERLACDPRLCERALIMLLALAPEKYAKATQRLKNATDRVISDMAARAEKILEEGLR